MLVAQKAPAKSSSEIAAGAAQRGRWPSKTTTRTVKVTHELGLHFRPCSAIVTTVSKHEAEVLVHKGDQSVNATSILGLLSLEAVTGTELLLSATGAEAQQAVDAVAGLFENGFQACS